MVLGASIPSMCEFPAGKLVGGVLKEENSEYPNATPPSLVSEKLVVAGDLTGDGVKELAATFYCDKGGVAWPTHIQLFQNTAKGIAPLGQPFQMGDVNGGARTLPSSLKYANGQLVVIDQALLPMEAAAAASGKIKATLKWNGKKLAASSIQDLAVPQNGTLKTATVNGTWCLLDGKGKSTTKDCLTIDYPNVTRKGEDAQTLSFSTNNGFTVLSYFDAPLGMIYSSGVKIQDPANPSVTTSQLQKDRLYNNQTHEVFVRQGK